MLQYPWPCTGCLDPFPQTSCLTGLAYQCYPLPMTSEKQDALVNVTADANGEMGTTSLSPIVPLPLSPTDLPHEALQYLIALRHHSTERKAMQYEHVGPVIVERWRRAYPAFVSMERDIELSHAGVELAKAHIKANALPVAEAMVSRATGTTNQAQRAGETVLEVAGVIEKQPLITINTQVQALSLELAKAQVEEDKPHA